jgi:solute carrier family 26 (sodium-independent sulfate anion transporter), member 11
LSSITANQHNNDDDEQYRETFPNLCDEISKKAAKACSVNGFKRRLPITEWLPKYEKSFFIQDFVAGLSVGLTAIPQGL